jgi:hypothetical protein
MERAELGCAASASDWTPETGSQMTHCRIQASSSNKKQYNNSPGLLSGSDAETTSITAYSQLEGINPTPSTASLHQHRRCTKPMPNEIRCKSTSWGRIPDTRFQPPISILHYDLCSNKRRNAGMNAKAPFPTIVLQRSRRCWH